MHFHLEVVMPPYVPISQDGKYRDLSTYIGHVTECVLSPSYVAVCDYERPSVLKT